MGEDYWERRRRHLNEDHAFRRAQSKRDIEILKGKHRIDETQDAIDRLAAEARRRERSERLKALLDEMQREKASILERIAACASAHKRQWSERLSGLDLAQPGADAELKKLREEVEEERELWSDFELPALPEWWKRATGAGSWLSPDSEFIEKSRSPSPPNALELKWEREQREREQQRKLREDELALIVSSLGFLISTRDLYEAT